MTSCSKDWLTLSPDTNYAKTVDAVVASVDSMEMSVYGMSRMMTQQYTNQWFNGEGTIKTLYGNYPGNDYQRSRFAGAKKLANMESMEDASALYSQYAWYYYYRIITNANIVINGADNAEGDKKKGMFLKAQALTYRAYCYHMLVQLYCKRWIDSNNGASRGVILRLGSTDNGKVNTDENNKACATLLESYQQIYADLNEAISLYTQSGLQRPDSCKYLPDVDAAYAIYARAALNREDWATAAQMAQKAYASHPLMSNTEYCSGFNTPNDEWIWSVHTQSSETIAFYGFFSHEGSNSSSSYSRNYPAAISKELYMQIPESDIRRNLFIDLPQGTYTVSTGVANAKKTAEIRAQYKDYLYASTAVCYLMQIKQRTILQPSIGDFNLFRSSEMYLIEAEADYYLGKEAEARAAITKLNKESGRNPEYSCEGLSGTDLLNEIRLYNRIELWGEGHDWFNYKRWGLPIERHGTSQGGNFYSTFVITVQPSDHNNWCWVIPDTETEYNNKVTAREGE